MRIVFRIDASLQMGTGHVMRCLTLADALRARGADCLFICRPHAGHLLRQVAKRGHEALELPALPSETFTRLPTDPVHAHWLGTDWERDAEETRIALGGKGVDWLVLDHYALDCRWEQALRPACRRLMVIDDLADRPHDCDIILDQNLGRTEEDYCGLLQPHTATLIGPKYALLRPEFAQLRGESLARRAAPQLRHLLITMGGVDKDNATERVLESLDTSPLPPEMRITVVMGPHAPWLAKVRMRAARMHLPTQVLVEVDNMARLMTDSDLAIGAAGSTSWERCSLGLPTIQLVLAENQNGIAEALAQAGAVFSTNAVSLNEILHHVFDDRMAMQNLLAQGLAASEVADGLGAQRVVSRLLKADQ